MPEVFNASTIPQRRIGKILTHFVEVHVLTNDRSHQITACISHPGFIYDIDTHHHLSTQLTLIQTIADTHLKFCHLLKRSLRTFTHAQFDNSSLKTTLASYVQNSGPFQVCTLLFLDALVNNHAVAHAYEASNQQDLDLAVLEEQFIKCQTSYHKQIIAYAKLLTTIDSLKTPDQMEISE